jgi:hypothetical protein
MIEYKTRFVRWTELWFGEPEASGNFDAVVSYRCPARRPGRCTEFFTLQVDLARSPDEIFQTFSRNTRAQIRKSAEVDDFRFEFIDHPDIIQLDAFTEFYNLFADSCNLPQLQRVRMIGLLNSGSLTFTKVSNPERALTWHANMSSRSHVGMLFSASHARGEESPEIRKMIGRANRCLHWQEILHYKEQGREVYDFGGWYEGSEDPRLLSINRFKEEFGGSKVLTFTIVEDRRLRAKFATILNRMIGVARKAKQGLRGSTAIA